MYEQVPGIFSPDQSDKRISGAGITISRPGSAIWVLSDQRDHITHSFSCSPFPILIEWAERENFSSIAPVPTLSNDSWYDTM